MAGQVPRIEQQAQAVITHLLTHHDEHWETLASLCGLPPGQAWWTEPYMSKVLRLAKERCARRPKPLELCPIYEFEVTDNKTGETYFLRGWWTIRPTEDISRVALRRSLLRNTSEQELNALTRQGRTFIGGIAAAVHAMLAAQTTLLGRVDYLAGNPVLTSIAARVGATY